MAAQAHVQVVQQLRGGGSLNLGRFLWQMTQGTGLSRLGTSLWAPTVRLAAFGDLVGGVVIRAQFGG